MIELKDNALVILLLITDMATYRMKIPVFWQGSNAYPIDPCLVIDRHDVLGDLLLDIRAGPDVDNTASCKLTAGPPLPLKLNTAPEIRFNWGDQPIIRIGATEDGR